MNNLQASNYTLLLSFVLVVVALLIGYKEKLGIDKDIIISVARAIVQLFIVGYILKFIIRSNNYLLTLAMILVILFNAAWNSKYILDFFYGNHRKYCVNLRRPGFNSFCKVHPATNDSNHGNDCR